ncbi:MAG TPA: hypothetical protein VLG39_07670 [Nitrospirota bacterium]|nr:hypothetical protein [Nitrospirota bacterium]
MKITREAFEEYFLAQSAVPALDTFRPKAIPAVEPAPETEPTVATRGAAGFAEAANEEPKPTEPSSSAVPDFLQEREEPSIPLPNPFEETSPLTEQTPLEEPPALHSPLPEEMRPEPVKEPEVAIEPSPRSEPFTESEPKQEPAPESAAESKHETAVDKGQDAGLVSVPVPEQAPVVVTLETPAVTSEETGPAVVAKPAAAVSTVASVSGRENAVPRKEPVHAAVTMTQKPVIGTVASQPVRSGRMVPLLLAAAIILVLAGFGAYLYVRPSPPPAVHEAGPVMVSTEGLQIINPAGSLDTNGDLLVSGVLENQTDQERANWYIVIDVYDAQGKALSAIGMLNGRQIYTKRDYEILAKRGVNIQELKEQARQPRGIVLPPRGRNSFEIRYLQPPDGIASFNASLQPFDPARLQKEIEVEAR